MLEGGKEKGGGREGGKGIFCWDGFRGTGAGFDGVRKGEKKSGDGGLDRMAIEDGGLSGK